MKTAVAPVARRGRAFDAFEVSLVVWLGNDDPLQVEPCWVYRQYPFVDGSLVEVVDG